MVPPGGHIVNAEYPKLGIFWDGSLNAANVRAFLITKPVDPNLHCPAMTVTMTAQVRHKTSHRTCAVVSAVFVEVTVTYNAGHHNLQCRST